jgi:hypothetical protein
MNAPKEDAKSKGDTKSKWPMKPISELASTVERQKELLDLSRWGIKMSTTRPQALDALKGYYKYKKEYGEKVEDEDEINEKQMEHAVRSAELAQSEIEQGFPFLNAQAVVLLWATLEAGIRTFFVGLLNNKPASMEIDDIQKLKIRFGDYHKLDEEERCSHLINKLEQELPLSSKAGVGRYESLFEVFKIKCDLEPDLKRDLMELHQIRNVIVHKANIIDRHFVNLCPWTAFKANDIVMLDNKTTDRYYATIMAYVLVLIIRVAEYDGKDLSIYKKPYKASH